MAATFLWKDEFVIDGDVIDSEHQKLIELANQVFEFANPSQQVEEVTAAVKEIFRYMEYHFDNEERLMQEVGFPELEDHRQSHQRIIEEMNSLITRNKNLNEFLTELRRGMTDWVLQHIIDEDHKISDYTYQKAVAAGKGS